MYSPQERTDLEEAVGSMRRSIGASMLEMVGAPRSSHSRMQGIAYLPKVLVDGIARMLIEKEEDLAPGFSTILDRTTGAVYWFERFATMGQAMRAFALSWDLHDMQSPKQRGTREPFQPEERLMLVKSTKDGVEYEVIKKAGPHEVIVRAGPNGRAILGKGQWTAIDDKPAPTEDATESGAMRLRPDRRESTGDGPDLGDVDEKADDDSQEGSDGEDAEGDGNQEGSGEATAGEKSEGGDDESPGDAGGSEMEDDPDPEVETSPAETVGDSKE